MKKCLGLPERRKTKKRSLLSGFEGNVALPIPSVWTSNLQNAEKMNYLILSCPVVYWITKTSSRVRNSFLPKVTFPSGLSHSQTKVGHFLKKNLIYKSSYSNQRKKCTRNFSSAVTVFQVSGNMFLIKYCCQNSSPLNLYKCDYKYKDKNYLPILHFINSLLQKEVIQT